MSQIIESYSTVHDQQQLQSKEMSDPQTSGKRVVNAIGGSL